MSGPSPIFIQTFDAQIKHEYQEFMRLRGSTRIKTSVQGSTHNFPLMGDGLAQPRTPGTEVTPMDVTRTQNPCVLQDWSAPVYSDIFNQQKQNINEVAELRKTVAGAMGRRMDQIIINEVNSAATNEVAVGTTGFTLEKLLEAKKILDNNGVPESDRYYVHDPAALQSALLLEKLTSQDYNVIRALVNGEVNTFAGFKFIMIGSGRKEGALPKVSTTRYNFAWHKEALGLAIGMDMNTKIDWVAQYTSWLVNGCFVAGAKVIDGKGLVKIGIKEA
jgi:hypothetical protein